MVKKRSWGLPFRWLIVSALCLLIVLSPMALMAKPAHAQSPEEYQALVPMLQQLRQFTAESLARYESADAKTRAAWAASTIELDATGHPVVPQPSYPQRLQHILFLQLENFYKSMPASGQAKIDFEFRRETGYTFMQLLQSASTLPDLMRILDLLITAVEKLGKGTIIITFGPTARDGMAFVKEAGYDWKPVSPAGQVMLVSEGSTVKTSQGSVVITDLPGQGDFLYVGENTEFQIEELGTVFEMRLGMIRGKVAKFLESKGVVVRCPPWAMSTRSTDFIVHVTPERADVLVFDGTVEFSDLEKHRTVLVKAGEYSVAAVGGLPTEPQRLDNTTVVQKYKSLFKSEEEMKAVVGNIEKLAKGGESAQTGTPAAMGKDKIEKPAKGSEAAGFPIYLLAIPVIVIAVVIGLVMRRMRRA